MDDDNDVRPLNPVDDPTEFCAICLVWLDWDEYEHGVCLCCRSDVEEYQRDE